MNRYEAAKKFLSKKSLKNSYLLADVDEAELKMDDEEDPKAIITIFDNSISMRGKVEALRPLLREILEGEHRFHSVDDTSFEAAEDILDVEDDHPTWMLKREPEHYQEPSVEVEQARVEDAEVINEYWGLGSEDSTSYIKSRIREGPGYVIRRDGRPVAWCLTHYISDSAMSLGFLHVIEEYRRQGFARSLTEAICQEALDMDVTPVVDIFQDNEASLSLAEGLGFEKIAENHWFTGIMGD